MTQEELMETLKKYIEDAKKDYEAPYIDDFERGYALGLKDAYEEVLRLLEEH